MSTPDLSKITDPALRANAEELFEVIRQQRALYHLPPEPWTMPTLAERKTGEATNARLLTQAVIARHGGKRDKRNWWRLWIEAGTHDRDLPHFAHHTIRAACWTPEAARDLALFSWSKPEWPGQYKSQEWREMFAAVGSLPLCTVNDDAEDEEEPVECHEHDGPVTVYRAAWSSQRHGLAWSLDLDKARWFASRGDMSGRGRRMRLWTTTVPHDRILAHITTRNEAEIVADVRGLQIKEVPDA